MKKTRHFFTFLHVIGRKDFCTCCYIALMYLYILSFCIISSAPLSDRWEQVVSGIPEHKLATLDFMALYHCGQAA